MFPPSVPNPVCFSTSLFFLSISLTFIQFTKSLSHNRNENFCKLLPIKIFQFIQSLVNNMYWNRLHFKRQSANKNQTLCPGSCCTDWGGTLVSLPPENRCVPKSFQRLNLYFNYQHKYFMFFSNLKTFFFKIENAFLNSKCIDKNLWDFYLIEFENIIIIIFYQPIQCPFEEFEFIFDECSQVQ